MLWCVPSGRLPLVFPFGWKSEPLRFSFLNFLLPAFHFLVICATVFSSLRSIGGSFIGAQLSSLDLSMLGPVTLTFDLERFATDDVFDLPRVVLAL